MALLGKRSPVRPCLCSALCSVSQGGVGPHRSQNISRHSPVWGALHAAHEAEVPLCTTSREGVWSSSIALPCSLLSGKGVQLPHYQPSPPVPLETRLLIVAWIEPAGQCHPQLINNESICFSALDVDGWPFMAPFKIFIQLLFCVLFCPHEGSLSFWFKGK